MESKQRVGDEIGDETDGTQDAEQVAEKKKYYQCGFILYPESQQAAIDWVQVNYSCAWALHDRDVWEEKDLKKYLKSHNGKAPEWSVGDLKKPHVHFLVSFKNQRYLDAVAKEITRKSGCNVPPNTIRIVNNYFKAFQYLWHENHPTKFQYDKEVVVHTANDFKEPTEREGVSRAEDIQVQTLLDMPDTLKSVHELSRWAYENGCWSAYRHNYAMWRQVLIDKQAERSHRLMDDAQNVLNAVLRDQAEKALRRQQNIMSENLTMEQLIKTLPFNQMKQGKLEEDSELETKINRQNGRKPF